MKKRNKKYLLYFFVFLAGAPFLQLVFHPLKLVGLNGAFETTNKPSLSFHNYIKASLQDSLDIYLKENTPFRGDMVRLRNQFDYSLFNNINTNLTLGKKNFIFDLNYIWAREGKDLQSDSLRKTQTKNFITAIHLLDSLNIPLLFVVAPNKANYYSEYLPYNSIAATTTNQSYYKDLISKQSIKIIDADTWFMNMKSKSAYPLMTKYGAHWSIYGATMVADSVIKTIESIKQKSFSSFSILNYEQSTKARYSDDDYLESLNLIQRWESPALAYPVLKFQEGDKPNVLIISDSFFWNFYDIGVMENCFSKESEMWYYNKTRYNSRREKENSLKSTIDLKDILSRDVIIIMATQPSFKNFAFSFFDQLSLELKNE